MSNDEKLDEDIDDDDAGDNNGSESIQPSESKELRYTYPVLSKDMLKAFELSRKLAKQFEVTDSQRRRIDSIRESLENSEVVSLISEIRGSNEKLYESMRPLFELESRTLPSPIFSGYELAELLSPEPGEIDEELEERLRDEIEIKIDQSSLDRDLLFNIRGYVIILNIEIELRELIYRRFIEGNEKMIENFIPPDVITKCNDRMKRERENPLVRESCELLDYSDFSDIKKILEKGSKIKQLDDLLNSDQFHNLISKLDELEPLRNKISHCRPLTKDEFEKLRVYAKDLSNVFNYTLPFYE